MKALRWELKIMEKEEINKVISLNRNQKRDNRILNKNLNLKTIPELEEGKENAPEGEGMREIKAEEGQRILETGNEVNRVHRGNANCAEVVVIVKPAADKTNGVINLDMGLDCLV
jgi:hypothetical protein